MRSELATPSGATHVDAITHLGSTFLYYAVSEMRDPGGVDDVRVFEFDMFFADVVEQPDRVTDQHGAAVDLQFVEQPGAQALLNDVRVARVPGCVRGARRGYDHLSFAEDALDAFHPQAKPAGEDLETLLLARVDMIRARGPSRLANPIDLEQLTACLSGGLPEHGPHPGDRVD
jgi:hypothetical protein